jgi:hypothetical protein
MRKKHRELGVAAAATKEEKRQKNLGQKNYPAWRPVHA